MSLAQRLFGNWVYQALIEYYVNQGRWADAFSHCEIALKTAPDNPWFHHLKSRIYLQKKQYSEAISASETALSQNDSVSWFHFQLGEARLKNGQVAAAIPSLQRSLELNSGFPWAYYHLGLALLNQNAFEEAIANFQTALNKVPQEQEMFQDCLAYAQYLQRQDQQIQLYCEAHRQRQQHTERPLDILLVTPYPTYPPKLGAITRLFQEVRGLGKKHNLVVASLIFDTKGHDIVEAMAQYCELPVVTLIGDHDPAAVGQPNLIHKYSSLRLAKMLKQLSAVNFDIVCFDFIYMAQYRHLFPNAYTVLGEHNIESELLKRFAALNPSKAAMEKLTKEASGVDVFVNADSEAVKLAAYEGKYWPLFDLRTVVSGNDRAELLSRFPNNETWVVKNGIDIEATSLLNNLESRKIFFFGTLTYFPNIDGATYFVNEVMPLIWKEEPDMQLCIAGAEPPKTVLALAEDPRIEVVISPEVMEDVAEDCHLSVVPLRVGSGTRIKILHSMAMGLPVVSTSLGCEGLDGVDGEHLLIRDGPEQIAEAVLALDRDRFLWEKLRTNGRNLVEEQYDWQAIYAEFEAKLFEAWQRKKQ